MVAFILFLILAWVVVGIIGFVVHRCGRHGVVHPVARGGHGQSGRRRW